MTSIRQAVARPVMTIMALVVATALIAVGVAGREIGPVNGQPVIALAAAHVTNAERPATAPVDRQVPALTRLAGNPARDYAMCVLGVGVPLGVALYFISVVGTKAAWHVLKNQKVPPGGPAGVAAKGYATKVWNSCGRFVRS